MKKGYKERFEELNEQLTRFNLPVVDCSRKIVQMMEKHRINLIQEAKEKGVCCENIKVSLSRLDLPVPFCISM
jgi:hypothetical protein